MNLFWKGIRSQIKSGLVRPIMTGRKIPNLQRGTVASRLKSLRQADHRWRGPLWTPGMKKVRAADIMFSHNALTAYLDTIKDSKLQRHRRAKRIYDLHFKTVLRPRAESETPLTQLKQPMQVQKKPVVHKLSAVMLKEAIRKRALQINKKSLKDKSLKPQIHCRRALSLSEQPILPCKRMINMSE